MHGNTIQFRADFSQETMEARRKWNNRITTVDLEFCIQCKRFFRMMTKYQHFQIKENDKILSFIIYKRNQRKFFQLKKE